MNLYHERQSFRTGALDQRDEEECFTGQGRKIGLWLTTERPGGESSFEADVDVAVLEAFEVTEEGSEHRVFVVPAQVVIGLGFREG